MMYNAVGIDVSKGKSTIAVLQPGGTVVRKPFDVKHSSSDLKSLVDYISSLEGDTKAVLECTGRYHEPVVRVLSAAGIFVSAVNPHLIRNFGNTLDPELRQQYHPESQIRPRRLQKDRPVYP